MELRFVKSLNEGIYFITGGIPGIEGTIAITESNGTLYAVGKLQQGVNVAITDYDRKILTKNYIQVIRQTIKLIPIGNLDESSEPIDVPMELKPSKKDRIANLIPDEDYI